MDERPLAGLRIVVTRAAAQTSSLAAGLGALGAEVIQLPTIAIEDPVDGGEALRRRLGDLSDADWLVVTSANGAHRAAAALAQAGHLVDESDLAASLARAGVQLAAIGPGTADALADHGLEPDLVPDRFVAEGLLDQFPGPPPRGGLVVLAQAAGARRVLAEGLREAGWQVETVEAYRTVHPRADPQLVQAAGGADVVTFTSASTVTGYVAVVGTDSPPPSVACIGPVTAAAARDAGFTVDIEAIDHTISGLIDAIIRHLTEARG